MGAQLPRGVQQESPQKCRGAGPADWETRATMAAPRGSWGLGGPLTPEAGDSPAALVTDLVTWVSPGQCRHVTRAVSIFALPYCCRLFFRTVDTLESQVCALGIKASQGGGCRTGQRRGRQVPADRGQKPVPLGEHPT